MSEIPGTTFSDKTQDQSGVQRLISDFIQSFCDLDWPRFKDCWAENPVIFYPSLVPNETGRRTDTVAGFEMAWRRQFDRIRDDARTQDRTSPPYHDIQPIDTRIDFLSATAAVVTFHIGPEEDVLGRRMLVALKTLRGWKITHLHASNMRIPGTR